MLSVITFNYLVWEDSNIPFPEEIKPLIDSNFYERTWNSAGLPVHGGRYSVTNGVLYLEQDSGVREQDFTGTVIIGTYVESTDPNADSFLCSFKVVFVKGRVDSVEVQRIDRQNTGEYQRQVYDKQTEIGKIFSRRAKWWYRWLYAPYYLVVRSSALVLIWVLNLPIILISKVAQLLTPW
jgi:hypothetical protein